MEFDDYDPAKWQDDKGLLVRDMGPADAIGGHRRVRRMRRALPAGLGAMMSMIFITSALALRDERYPFRAGESSALHLSEIAVTNDVKSEGDLVDPSVWPKAIAYLSSLPRTELVESDDPPTFI